MREHAIFDKIDLHLIRVLHTVLTERSVSRAALRLGTHQPAVSASLKRLREFAREPLLVRSGSTYWRRFVGRLRVCILPCPVAFPRMRYYQLWHQRSHASASVRWLRERVKSVATRLAEEPPTG